MPVDLPYVATWHTPVDLPYVATWHMPVDLTYVATWHMPVDLPYVATWRMPVDLPYVATWHMPVDQCDVPLLESSSAIQAHCELTARVRSDATQHVCGLQCEQIVYSEKKTGIC